MTHTGLPAKLPCAIKGDSNVLREQSPELPQKPRRARDADGGQTIFCLDIYKLRQEFVLNSCPSLPLLLIVVG